MKFKELANRLKELANRLNGWQRLYVAILLFAYLPLAIMFIDARAEVEEPSRDIVISILEKNNISKLPNSDSSISWENSSWQPPELNGEIQNGRRKFQLNYGYGWRFDITMLDSTDMSAATKFVNSVDSALGSYYSLQLWKSRALLGLLVVLFAVIFYLIGWTIGWVYRGFRKK
jgi:hypothetical protein